MKNYYWNHGAKFPITEQDVIDGKAYLYLEGIRKLCFLLQFPAAGYYYNDYPCDHIIKGKHGELPVYLPDTGKVKRWDSGTETYTYTAFNTWCESFDTTAWTYEKAEIRLWCDGVIWASNAPTDKYTNTTKISDRLKANPPVNGGWLAPDTSSKDTKYGWHKRPSRNKYYEWDLNSLRLYMAGDVAGSGVESIYFDLGGQGYNRLPKNFDPFEVIQPLYRVANEGTETDGVAEADIIGNYSESITLQTNKYFWYPLNNVMRLWKCLDGTTEDTPSLSSSDWELWIPSTINYNRYKFNPQDIEIKKHQFFNEDIQGALYGMPWVAGSPYTNPGRSFTQYSINPAFPDGEGGTGATAFFNEVKMCETICAYIEALFDWGSFYAEVDNTYKTRYHALCGGIYNGYSYDSYDKALGAGKVPLFASIKDVAWDCNRSGFEWALKRIGSYDIYYDTKYPFIGNGVGSTGATFWEMYLDEGGPGGGDIHDDWVTVAQEIYTQCVSNGGCWRRTWKYSVGKPQESTVLRKTTDTLSPTRRYNVFPRQAYWASAPSAQDIIDYKDACYSQMTGCTSVNNGVPTWDSPTESNTTNRHEPDYEFGDGTQITAREWNLGNLVDLVNEIWQVLNVDMGYPEQTPHLEVKYFVIGNFMGPLMVPVPEANDIFRQRYRDAVIELQNDDYWDGDNSFNIMSSDWVKTKPVKGTVVEQAFRLGFGLKLDFTGFQIAHNSSVKLGVSYHTHQDSESTSLVNMSGNISLPISVGAGVPLGTDPRYKYLHFKAVDGDYRGLFFPTPLYVTSKNCVSDGQGGSYCSWWSQLSLNFYKYDILVEYNWNKILSAVWQRDGNFPRMVKTFQLPLIPPKPNPPAWVNPLTYLPTGNDIANSHFAGYIGSTTTVPAMRDIQYKLKISSEFFVAADIQLAFASWSSSRTYRKDFIVRHEHRIYQSLIADNNEDIYNSNAWKYLRPSAQINDLFDFDVDDEDYDFSQTHIEFPPQDSPFFSVKLQPTAHELLEFYVWHCNLYAWQCEARSYEEDIEIGDGYDTDPDTGEPYYCKWGVDECDFSSGLSKGIKEVAEWETGVSTGFPGNYYLHSGYIWRAVVLTSNDPSVSDTDWEQIEQSDTDNESGSYVGDWGGSWDVLANIHNLTGSFNSQDTVIVEKTVDDETYKRAIITLLSTTSDSFLFYSSWILET